MHGQQNIKIYFNFSTFLGQLCAHHQENVLYLCDTGIFHSVCVAVRSADRDECNILEYMKLEVNICSDTDTGDCKDRVL